MKLPIKSIGCLLLILNMTSCSGWIRSKDQNQKNDEFNISGKTAYLLDLLIPSSLASDEKRMCPKGFYPSPIGKGKVSDGEDRAACDAHREGVDLPEVRAGADCPDRAGNLGWATKVPEIVEEVTCPNALTTCSTPTCASLYSLDPVNGETLICTVPVNKFNQYEFKFTGGKPEGVTAGKIVISSNSAISVVERIMAPNLCRLPEEEEKIGFHPPDTSTRRNASLPNTQSDSSPDSLTDEKNFECLPNPVEYREIVFEIGSEESNVVADSDPTTTLESSIKKLIHTEPSETLKKIMKDNLKGSLTLLKNKMGDKPDFDDPEVYSQFTDSTIAEDALTEEIINHSNSVPDFEKISEELQQKTELEDVTDPSKLNHINKRNNIILNLMGNMVDLLTSQEDQNKIYSLIDDLDKKRDEITEKAYELKTDAFLDPKNKGKARNIAILDQIPNDLPRRSLKAKQALSSVKACQSDLSDEKSFDLKERISLIEETFLNLTEVRNKQTERTKKEVEEVTNQLRELQDVLSKVIDSEISEKGADQILKLNQEVDQGLRQRRKLMDRADQLQSESLKSEIKYYSTLQKTFEQALAMNLAEIEATTDETILKELFLTRDELNEFIKKNKEQVMELTKLLPETLLKMRLERLNDVIKVNIHLIKIQNGEVSYLSKYLDKNPDPKIKKALDQLEESIKKLDQEITDAKKEIEENST